MNIVSILKQTHLIKEFEGPVVNVDLIEGEVVLQALQEVRHGSLNFYALQMLIFDLQYFNMDLSKRTSYIFEVQILNRSVIGLALGSIAYFLTIDPLCFQQKCLPRLVYLPQKKLLSLSGHRDRHIILKRWPVDTLQTFLLQNVRPGLFFPLAQWKNQKLQKIPPGMCLSISLA